MQCEKCGYLMDAFDKDCPRCLRVGVAAAPTDTTMVDDPLPMPTILNGPPPARTKAKPTKPERDPPYLGWPLTISLWVYIGVFVLAFIGTLASDKPSGLFGIICGLVASIALLRCKRWGFFVLSIGTLMPIILSLFYGGLANPLNWILGAGAIVIVAYSADNWDKLD